MEFAERIFKMNLIIETDLGHDPDDLFTLLHLSASGESIRLLLITPGDLDQIAIAKFLSRELEWDVPIVAAKNSDKMSSGSIHHELLKKYKHPLHCKGETSKQPTYIENTLREYPDSEFLIIGPPKTTGHYFKHNYNQNVSRLTMQGGFLPYHLHTFPAKRLDKFTGKLTVPTFNMNGAVEETKAIITSDRIVERQFVGKNVCHTIEFNRDKLENFNSPPNRAAELFLEAAKLYFNKHESKKFHDPVAMICHKYPEVGDWVYGKPFRSKGEWGTNLDNNGDKILANLNEETFWGHLYDWT